MALLTSPSLQNIISGVRNLLNQPDRLNSFWSDEELSRYVNDAIMVYFTEVVHNNEGLFTTTADLSIASGTETVPLPTDCFRVRSVYKATSSGMIILQYRNNVTEGYDNASGAGSAESYSPYYYFRGQSLVLRPIPNFTEANSLHIEYIQFPLTLVDGGDVLTNNISPIFRQLVEMYAVYKAKLKESLVNGVSVHGPAEENLTAIYASFKQSIALRSASPQFIEPFNPENQ